MFVQKKYPEVTYTMHVELTQAEVERIVHDMDVVAGHLLENYLHPAGAFRDLYQLVQSIKQEADLPFRPRLGC